MLGTRLEFNRVMARRFYSVMTTSTESLPGRRLPNASRAVTVKLAITPHVVNDGQIMVLTPALAMVSPRPVALHLV